MALSHYKSDKNPLMIFEPKKNNILKPGRIFGFENKFDSLNICQNFE